MSGSFMFQCPSCKAVYERKCRGGVVCEDCHVFMKRVIPMDAFEKNEDIEITMEEADGRAV